MEAEFRAVGVPRTRKGARFDHRPALEFLARNFAADKVESHGQKFLFRPESLLLHSLFPYSLHH
jgi:hypothetical protein